MRTQTMVQQMLATKNSQLLAAENAARIRKLQGKGRIASNIDVEKISTEMAEAGKLIPENITKLLGRTP